MDLKKISLIAACVLMAVALNGQAFPGHDWRNGPPMPKGAPSSFFAMGQSAVAAGGGTNIFVGYFSTGSTMDAVIWKTSSLGKVLWRKVIAGTGNDYLKHVASTPDGNFIAAGVTESPEWVTGTTDMLLVKFNTNGRILWRKTFGSSGTYSQAFSCGVGANGGFFAFGFTGNGPYKFMLVKVDNFGRENWRRIYDIGYHEFGASAVATKDGGYLLFGEAQMSSGSDTDLLLVKTDGKGNYLTHRYYGGSGIEWAFYSFSPTGNNLIETPATAEYPAGYVFCGMDMSAGGAVVCRVDGSDLSEVWYNHYSSELTDAVIYSAYAVRHMGSNLLVAGSAVPPGNEVGHAWLLDPAGNPLWNHRYASPAGAYNPLFFILPLFDQSFFTGGMIYDGIYHFYLTRCFKADGSPMYEKLID